MKFKVSRTSIWGDRKPCEELENTKGVGPKTFDRIMKTVKEMGI